MARRESEQNAAPEAELYRLLAENVQDQAIVVLDAQRRVQTWPPGAERLLGYRREEMLGESADILFTPDDRERGVPQQELEQAKATGRGESDRLHVRRDGTRFWATGSVTPLWDECGELRGFAKIIRDVAAHQDSLRESEARFRSLVEQAPFSVQVFAPNGDTLQVNRAWERLWGVKFDETPGYNILHDAQLKDKGVHTLLRRAFAGEPVTLPPIQYDPEQSVPGYSHHQDARRWVSAVAYPLKDRGGRVREVVLVHHDITAQKRAEEALRASEERFRGIISRSIAGVAEVDLTGRYLFANNCYCEFVGRSLKELRGLRMQDITHPDDLPENLSLFERIAHDDQPYVIEKRYLRPDGAHVWVNNSVSGLRGPDGRVTSIVAVCVDVTARRQAEEALRKANRALVETDRRKDEFLAMLAHELRNPLAPIRSGLELLALMQTGGEVVETMQHQVEHLVRLVDDLLDVSRIMRGKIELRRQRVDFASAIERAVEAVRPSAEARTHRLEVELPDQPVTLHADPVRLAQVVGNLLNNAVKYTPDGGDITIAARRDGDAAVLCVRDSGAGIDAALLPHVFDLFHQGDQTLDRADGGLGIGLTLVKNLVEMHGGSVTVASEGTGRGSEFTVVLPALPRSVSRHSAPAPSGSSERPYRILVVDDHVPAARMTAILLSKLGPHQVSLAHDGAGAVEAASEHPPHVILLDAAVAGTDGGDVIQRLRQQKSLQHALIVALSDHDSEADRQQWLEAGCDEVRRKPLDAEQLRTLLAHSKLCGL